MMEKFAALVTLLLMSCSLLGAVPSGVQMIVGSSSSVPNIIFGGSAISGYSGGSSNLSISTGSLTVPAGALVVVGISQDDDHTPPSSITDASGSNVYTHVTAADSALGGGDFLTVWYSPNVAGFTGVVTATWAVSHAYTSMIARYYTGAVGTQDAASGTSDNNFSTNPPMTSNSLTTTSANEVIVAFGRCNPTSQTYSVGTIGGVTAQNLVADAAPGAEAIASEDLIVSSIQSAITATMQFPGTANWEFSVVSFP